MLKTIFNCNITRPILFGGPVLFALLLGLGRADAASAEDPARVTQRLAQVVDYVAADYSGAVRDGQVIEASEWKEQQELLGEARKLVPQMQGSDGERAGLAAQLAEVVQAVEAKAAPLEVQKRCRAVRQSLKDTFHLRMVPAAAVDATRGAELYAQLCTSCHGQSGRADTPTAAALKPPPVSFHDAERMSKVSPALAYHALSFGIVGTAMAPFDTLSAQDRWNLAFYVVGLRHGTPTATAATALAPNELDPAARKRFADLALLAELSDEELSAELDRTSLSADAKVRALGQLRTAEPFARPSGSSRFERARTLIADAQKAAQGGDFATAHRLAISAYLDGIEPHEAGLRIDRPELLPRIEAAFAGLRQASDPDRRPSLSAMTQESQAIFALLADAEYEKGSKGGVWKAFLASLVIALREGIEVALLIAALLAFLRKSGQGALSRSVHAGWLASVPAGLLTFLLVGKLVDGARRELAEGILTLFAATILLSVTHWVLGAKEARHWLGFLRRRVEAVGSGQAQAGRGQSMWLFGIAFFAAYREALETALFYRALLFDVGPNGLRQVLAGIAVGVAVLAVLVVVVGRIGRKLNPRPVMLASSALLALLALALTGHGIHALQEGGYLGMRLIIVGGAPWSGLPSIGIHATWQGVGAQAVVLALLVSPSIIEKIRAARTRAPGSSSLPQPTQA